MQTVEFDSYIENGVIAVPLQFHDVIAHPVRVILQSRDKTPNTVEVAASKKELYSLAVDMTGFNFDRNEINER